MGLEKAIEHGKEHRKPYRGSRRFDALCRNHGACVYCRWNRTHNLEKATKFAEEDIKLAKKANDFEEGHGWCPDYGSDVKTNVSKEKYNEIMSEGLAHVLDILHKADNETSGKKDSRD